MQGTRGIQAALVVAALALAASLLLRGRPEAEATLERVPLPARGDEPGDDLRMPAAEPRRASASPSTVLLRVEDVLGRAIAGAAVAHGVEDRWLHEGGSVRGRTSDLGTLVVDVSAYAEAAPFVVSHPGYVPNVVSLARGMESALVVLETGKRFTVRVREPGGIPVEGAVLLASRAALARSDLEAFEHAWTAPGGDPALAVLRGRTDAEGYCRFQGAATGSYYVYTPHWLQVVDDTETPIRVRAEDETVVYAEELYGFAVTFEGDGIVSAMVGGNLSTPAGTPIGRRRLEQAIVWLKRRSLDPGRTLATAGFHPVTAEPRAKIDVVLADGTVRRFEREAERIDRLDRPDVLRFPAEEVNRELCAEVRLELIGTEGAPESLLPRLILTAFGQPETESWSPPTVEVRPGRTVLLPPGDYRVLNLRNAYDVSSIGPEVSLSAGERTTWTTRLARPGQRIELDFRLDGARYRPARYTAVLSASGSTSSRRVRDQEDPGMNWVAPGRHELTFHAPGVRETSMVLDVCAPGDGTECEWTRRVRIDLVRL
ncbi:MAG: hypothetical protein AAGB93_05365 [Planctomycetota bacterium]